MYLERNRFFQSLPVINSLEDFLILFFFCEKKPKPFSKRKTRLLPSLILNITETFHSNSVLPQTITNRIYAYLISPP